jgi:SAM-dependent methyltransferase
MQNPIISHRAFLTKLKGDVGQLYRKWDILDKNSGYPINYQGITDKSEPLLARFNHLTGRNVLDIGCNSGLYSYVAGYYAKSVIGCDVEQLLIDRARVGQKFFADFYDARKVQFHCGNFVDKMTNEIDAIVAACVLYHIGDDNLIKLMDFLMAKKPMIILQVRPARAAAFSHNSAWGTVSTTTLFGGMFRLDDNLEFLRACNYDNVIVAGLNSTSFYGETFPVLIAFD